MQRVHVDVGAPARVLWILMKIVDIFKNHQIPTKPVNMLYCVVQPTVAVEVIMTS